MQDIAAPAATRDALVDLKKNLRKQIKQDLKLMSSEDMQQQSEHLVHIPPCAAAATFLDS